MQVSVALKKILHLIDSFDSDDAETGFSVQNSLAYLIKLYIK